MGMGRPSVFLLQAGCKTACLYLEPSAIHQPDCYTSGAPDVTCSLPPARYYMWVADDQSSPARRGDLAMVIW
jgi:hypothetical protein